MSSSSSSSSSSRPCTPELSESETYFDAICDASHNYPYNFACSTRGKKARQGVAETWDRESLHVFHPRLSDPPLKIYETCDCATPCNCQSLDANVKSLQELRLNPNIHSSIQSKHSKEQLRCPTNTFKYLCTYQQIPPSFLTCLYSFRRSLSAHEWCNLPQFNDDNTLLSKEKHILPLPGLNRSGREIRYSFVLRSVESSESITTKPKSWGIRQLAVYHSFDVVSGQAFWVTCKGNSLNEELFKEALSDTRNELDSVPECFNFSLETLGMILDWCDSNWIFYINELLQNVKPQVDKARTPGIHDEARLSSDVRHATGLSSTPSEKSPGCAAVLLHDGKHRVYHDDRAKKFEDRLKKLEDEDWVKKLQGFSFDDVEGLQQGLEKIQEALLVLKLNKQVVRQIREHYECVMNEYTIPVLESIQAECRFSGVELFQRAKGVEANLEARQAQLEALFLLVKESKEMYKTLQINKLYAESAKLSALKMEDIAFKTKRETSSMHIITFVTLIFLPGTFMASFFQSGILEWPSLNADEPWDLGGSWKLNTKIFGLFFGISASITLVTVMLWMFVLFMLRRSLRD
ncbi:hypothetical protein FGSG_12829 [Fusarium graminearum PH-1]|uniref:Chromosome 3, complete genome n=1 Tax=Gibberella zeae (strain ATCC MYA-4620 / CBS 123657 / FGSC 9075 / NRRL 31084 / PH-1) TaxID=229533 RepID=I1S7K6_GIBZE|nr:hypothetical protein FGSG_12829 [Fusarium graminearum PH-1]ESU11893.1 hypothetical protein FGSG_12829 [Fusarium graminearum PH-1]EYB33971.1 hypothetical protein FG05_12829 [Fusarium graminearum]CEF88189.1 unnamed protein product [Fusarium graminearum]|eukprot:XP_011324469.1 hypothetical protein FGSG_12829 [Fusarium graminearum PH-1]